MSGKGVFCEEPSKGIIDVCCLLEMRWRRQVSRMLGVERRYKFWWSVEGDGVGCV